MEEENGEKGRGIKDVYFHCFNIVLKYLARAIRQEN